MTYKVISWLQHTGYACGLPSGQLLCFVHCTTMQAGAAKVYAVEASGMAKYAQILASSNAVGKAIQVRCELCRTSGVCWLPWQTIASQTCACKLLVFAPAVS